MRESFPALALRLSEQSVKKHYAAYQDVPWDEPDFRIDAGDPRWELPDEDPLAHSGWYRAQPPPVRSRIGLHVAASFMKVGVQFESVLKRGLLEFALRLPNRAPEFRYAYHEVAEETQHSLMFQEFVNRSGFDPRGLPGWRLAIGRRLAHRAARCPALFFIAVLAGEEPIDHVQRALLKSDRELPPVLERIVRIHVMEEARHLCFAREFLRAEAPRLPRVQRALLSVRTPILLRNLAWSMLCAAPEVAQIHGIPRSTLAEAYSPRNPLHAERLLGAVAKTRALCEELGFLTRTTRPLWRRLGLL